MATFTPFVQGTGVRRNAPDLTLAPENTPLLTWLPLVSQGGPSFPLLAPATAVIERRSITTVIPEMPGATVMLRLSPLPFASTAVFRNLPAYPTFWFAIITNQVAPESDHLLRGGELIVDAGAAWVGMELADRVTLTPAAWIEQIALAMTGHDNPADIATWRQLNRFDGSDRELRVLDHVGRPAPGQRLQVTDPAAGTSAITTDATGTLPLPPGDVELRWQSEQPVHALYERSLADTGDRASSTPPGQAVIVPAAVTSGHLQILDAAQWFAPRPPQLDPGLGLVHADSRLEPLVDGDTFRLMLDDLRAATGAGGGAHFAGWSFNDFPLDLADPEHTMFSDIIRGLTGGSTDPAAVRQARFLMDKYLVFRPDAPTDTIERLILILLILGVDTLLIVSIIADLKVDDAGFLVAVGVVLAGFAGLNLLGLEPALEKLADKIDGSKDFAETANAITANIALRARHPARFIDNPLQVLNVLPFDPSDFADGVGSYHQKFQVIRRAADSLGNRVVGYVGGIDMNRNRLDTPGHHGRSWRPPDQASNVPSPQAFHDVHARITGPAAADVALTFDRRWAFDCSREPPRPPGSPPLLDLAFPTPSPDNQDEVPRQDARHLIQVGRSGYTPNPTGVSTPLPWSPAGEATIPEAMIAAIDAAEEYIYIEDQYFTPPDSYIRALLEASRKPKMRLLIVIPTSSDQLFGDIRRREMFERLRDDPATGRGWGDRMIVGALVRRPVLADAGRVASKGRLTLLETIGPGGGNLEITLGPRSRLPKDVPFWLWIEGEQMLAVEKHDDLTIAWQRDDGISEEIPARHYEARRSSGPEPSWGARPRDHIAGAPVTLSQTHGIYVHTKAIIVDDVFVGIGSCNANRRGMFHDSEITAFAIPEQLKASRENPALNLRTALWAEHLGIPPAMGASLLADPVAAFELFRRPTLIGNRVSGFDALGIKPELGFPSESHTLVQLLAIFGIVQAETLQLVQYVWNIFADPVTLSDPDRDIGPGLGTV